MSDAGGLTSCSTEDLSTELVTFVHRIVIEMNRYLKCPASFGLSSN